MKKCIAVLLFLPLLACSQKEVEEKPIVPPPLCSHSRKDAESVMKTMSQVQECFNKALKRDKELNGKIKFDLKLNSKGKVLNTRVDRQHTSINDKKLHKCLARYSFKWNFSEAAEKGARRTCYILYLNKAM